MHASRAEGAGVEDLVAHRSARVVAEVSGFEARGAKHASYRDSGHADLTMRRGESTFESLLVHETLGWACP